MPRPAPRSWNQKYQDGAKANQRLLEIKTELTNRLATLGIEGVYLPLKVWGDRLVEFRDSYRYSKIVREKALGEDSFVFDFEAVVQIVAREQEIIKAQEAKRAIEKQERALKVTQYKGVLWPTFQELVQNLPPESIKALGCSTNMALQDCEALEFTVKFQATTPEEAAKQVELLKEFVRIFGQG